MRVKLLIALALASIFLLVSSLPAGAVEGVTGVNSFSSVVGTPVLVAPVAPSVVVPCVSFQAPATPIAGQCLANTITLGGPAAVTVVLAAELRIADTIPAGDNAVRVHASHLRPLIEKDNGHTLRTVTKRLHTGWIN